MSILSSNNAGINNDAYKFNQYCNKNIKELTDEELNFCVNYCTRTGNQLYAYFTEEQNSRYWESLKENTWYYDDDENDYVDNSQIKKSRIQDTSFKFSYKGSKQQNYFAKNGYNQHKSSFKNYNYKRR